MSIFIFLLNSYPTCISLLLCCCKATFLFLGVTYPPHCSPNHDQSFPKTWSRYIIERTLARAPPHWVSAGGAWLWLGRKRARWGMKWGHGSLSCTYVTSCICRTFIFAFTQSWTGGGIMDGVNLRGWRKAARIDPSVQTGDQLSPCNEPIQGESRTHTHTHTDTRYNAQKIFYYITGFTGLTHSQWAIDSRCYRKRKTNKPTPQKRHSQHFSLAQMHTDNHTQQYHTQFIQIMTTHIMKHATLNEIFLSDQRESFVYVHEKTCGDSKSIHAFFFY